jgi:uncharacterized protein YdeI (YjbR/CyaY-like superfamily)
MKPIFFATADDFRAWFEQHHAAATELLVGFVKKSTGRPSLTWPESVDQALCFGWIDGVRRRLDDERYTIRFTPRQPGSRWSAVNIARAAVLQKQGRMRPAGAAAVEARSAAKSRTYSYEQAKEPELAAALQKTLKANTKAAAFFAALPPSYRKKIVHWVMAAKGDDVRVARLQRAIVAFAAGRRL